MGVQTSESCDLSIILLVRQKPTATFLFSSFLFFFVSYWKNSCKKKLGINFLQKFISKIQLAAREEELYKLQYFCFFLPFFRWFILSIGCLPFGPCPFCPHVLNPNSEFSFSPLQFFLTYIVLHIPISLVEMLKLPISCQNAQASISIRSSSC